MLTKDLALCLRAVDYSETSQIVTLFARSAGKISAIAKGSKRLKSPFEGPIEPFAYGQIVFSSTDTAKLATLTEFAQSPAFTVTAANHLALNAALFSLELTSSLVDDFDPHPELFDSLVVFLKNLCRRQTPADKQPDTLALLILFQLTLLGEIGLQPILNSCVNCRSPRVADWPQAYFSSSANGLLCKDCEAGFQDKIKLSHAAAACLADLKTIADVSEPTLTEIEKILITHFTEILHKPPKMAKYINPS